MGTAEVELGRNCLLLPGPAILRPSRGKHWRDSQGEVSSVLDETCHDFALSCYGFQELVKFMDLLSLAVMVSGVWAEKCRRVPGLRWELLTVTNAAQCFPRLAQYGVSLCCSDACRA